jgi:outer membrane scaffolding protein for murein synthesis (MipA/OmpV family)
MSRQARANFMKRFLSTPLFGAGLATVVGGAALGQEAANNDSASRNYLSVGLGAGVGPDYTGSDDYGFGPFPSVEIGYEGFVLRSSGLGVAADLIPSEIVEFGPIIRQGEGRDKSVKDTKVKLLPKIDSEIEVGVFLGSGIPLEALGMDTKSIVAANVEYIHGLKGGHEGSTFAGSLSLVTPVSDQLSFVTSVSTTYIDNKYANAFYGISSDGSAASGLAAYTAKGGFSDVGVSLASSYQWTEAWSIGATVGYTRIIGDAAKSPIVKDRGSVDQYSAGVGLTYTFK